MCSSVNTSFTNKHYITNNYFQPRECMKYKFPPLRLSKRILIFISAELVISEN